MTDRLLSPKSGEGGGRQKGEPFRVFKLALLTVNWVFGSAMPSSKHLSNEMKFADNEYENHILTS